MRVQACSGAQDHVSALQQGMPSDPDERPLWPWWKTQKWVQHIAKRLFSRYGDAKACKPGTDQQFAELWSSKCSMTFLQAQMQLVSQVAQVTSMPLQHNSVCSLHNYSSSS